MSNATGFLLRTSLSDTGTLPRGGNWTGCPDIIPAGTTAISSESLIQSYGSVTDKPITQGLTNYLYLRAKNMNSTPLTQKAYMFQVIGSLVLRPELWYNRDHLVLYENKTGSSPVKQDYQVLTANAGQIAVTNAYTWKPDNYEHHCLVGVVADSWDAVLANYPPGGSMDALAQWIYMNPSMGWHNVTILPITSTVYESSINYSHSAVEESITFTIVANNVPVGARVSFSSNTSTSSGQVIGQDWTTVSAPAGGGSINPDFQLGTALTVEQGYKTVITYRTDFNGRVPPANFKMSMRAIKSIKAPSSANRLSAGILRADSLLQSYHRAYSPNTLFRSPSGEIHGRGIAGYRNMFASAPWGDGDDLEDTVAVLIGSHTTTPVSS